MVNFDYSMSTQDCIHVQWYNVDLQKSCVYMTVCDDDDIDDDDYDYYSYYYYISVVIIIIIIIRSIIIIIIIIIIIMRSIIITKSIIRSIGYCSRAITIIINEISFYFL